MHVARAGDLTRIHDLPVTIDGDAFAAAHELATELVAAGRAWEQLNLHADDLSISSSATTAMPSSTVLISRGGSASGPPNAS